MGGFFFDHLRMYLTYVPLWGRSVTVYCLPALEFGLTWLPSVVHRFNLGSLAVDAMERFGKRLKGFLGGRQVLGRDWRGFDITDSQS